MDYLYGLLASVIGDERWVRLAFLLAVALSVGLAAATVAVLAMGLQDPVRRRLAVIKRGGDWSHGEAPQSGLQLLLEQVGQRFVSQDAGQAPGTRMLLLHAGFRSASAVQVYWATRVLLPLLLLVGSLLVLPLVANVSLTSGLLAAGVAVGLGWLTPALYVERRKDARQTRLRGAFPDALDLMVVCVESGLALPQAIERVAEEMSVSQVELAEELATVNAEIRAGIPSATALANLAERTGLEDMRGLVSLLAQSIRFGTSVADTLRIYAEEFRDRRTQAAEEQAAKIGTKLVFPLIFCLWPSFFLVAIGPAMIGVLKAFGRL
ncbi:type II secretion system F family protein [Pseudomonas stutzeri]|uniref:Type II secretion system F family protein n=1 Tax=Stutzerimonas stutzeri TaxID=316 RepID=A0A2N8T0U9_STUST|nr:type II secretion system F family protein [Stutzerimonas stutzeri]EQM72326.1 type II secretion system protein [Stutzerimonas stutzeri MF28]MCQ4251385.1 type II secretion system F family protein [Stutzerimonas stutzeri]PNG08368.1 type II secretion system F family protein [Stutzerimonas stutzeri]